MQGTHARRAASYVAIAIMIALTAYLRLFPRSASLPLETAIDGPNPATAAGVLVFLHGRGGSTSRTANLVKRVRDAGLPADISVVLIQAPFPTLYGYFWGDNAADSATSRARVRARLSELLEASGPAPKRVVLAGFSQGAGLAGDIAAEDARIGALASFSPCWFWLRQQLPSRAGLRVLLAHGNRDGVCPVNESRSLATVLENARVPVQYLEFDGAHTVPDVAIRALVALATAP